jgi:hypothetical protein
MRYVAAVLITVMAWPSAGQDIWTQAESRGHATQEVIQFCNRFVNGWLTHADPKSGLIPRNLRGDWYWNARDSAADNYPFMVLTAKVTGNAHMDRSMRYILEQEKKLTSRVDSLPDTFDFATQAFLTPEVKMTDIIFGASEYAKDGLMPITEWIGPGPYLERMEQMMRDVWKHAAVETPVGLVPSDNLEVSGELLQVLSRLYWLTGDEEIKARAFRLADYYLLHDDLTQHDRIRLRDHGCEILSGLSEAYFIASREDAPRHAQYKGPLYKILDNILEKGVNDDGMMPSAYNPKTGEQDWGLISDGWGYVYNAFLTVAQTDGEQRYEDAVRHALENAHKYIDADWERGSADGYADAIEGALNMLNRIPVANGFEFVEKSVPFILEKQRPDGIIEGWHGDGNSARTLLMYALWKTEGIAPAPWREDMRVGAVRAEDGAVHVVVNAEFPWHGALRVDRPRHNLYFHMPLDYPRINQFPEWFTVGPAETYRVTKDDEAPVVVQGKELWRYPLALEAGQTVRLIIEKEPISLRSMAYPGGGVPATTAWQEGVRAELAKVLHIEDLLANKAVNPLNPELIHREEREGYTWAEYSIHSTPGRRISVVLTTPSAAKDGAVPAVVALHGHGGNRYSPYDTHTNYKGFAAELARTMVTVSPEVGQHQVYEAGRTLMGERLWDAIRCVDLLTEMAEVDADRIGCAGLSLGGEMAMWLGAMDPRVQVTVSSGFLTTMDHMEVNHCMCWKFPGLRELVEWTDVFALIAPRPLMCQNGWKEPYSDFTVGIARPAMAEIRKAYAPFGAEDKAVLAVHDGAHEIESPALVAFFEKHLAQ